MRPKDEEFVLVRGERILHDIAFFQNPVRE